MGTGSGAIAIYCAKKGAKVIASDISFLAARTAKLNSRLNKVNLDIRECDLFDCYVPGEEFDIIIFNPPFFPVRIKNDSSAMYASGENYDTIIRFFVQSKKRLRENGFVLITLSSLIQTELILGAAKKLGYSIEKIYERKGMPLEKLYLYKLSLTS